MSAAGKIDGEYRATNKNLEAAIKGRAFREDLDYRLKMIHIHPPLFVKYPKI